MRFAPGNLEFGVRRFGARGRYVLQLLIPIEKRGKFLDVNPFERLLGHFAAHENRQILQSKLQLATGTCQFDRRALIENVQGERFDARHLRLETARAAF